MKLRRTVAAGVASTALAAVAAAVPVPPAEARWSFHDSAVGEVVVAPDGGTRADTCRGRLRAVAGWATFVDVGGGQDPATVPVPPDAFSPVRYQVWEAPAGFDGFDSASLDQDTGGVVFTDAEGVAHPARLAGSATTPARSAVETPRPAGGDPGRSDNYVFTTAPFSVALTGVRTGDLLGLAPRGSGGGIFVELRAIDCGLPVRGARVDLLPGSTGNVVQPHVAADLLPVRIFGSPRLQVRQLERVRLGEAAPVAVRAPRDHDRDGRADRVYLFAQGDTDIQCVDRGVVVTGRAGDRERISARSPIVTAGCSG